MNTILKQENEKKEMPIQDPVYLKQKAFMQNTHSRLARDIGTTPNTPKGGCMLNLHRCKTPS